MPSPLPIIKQQPLFPITFNLNAFVFAKRRRHTCSSSYIQHQHLLYNNCYIQYTNAPYMSYICLPHTPKYIGIFYVYIKCRSRRRRPENIYNQIYTLCYKFLLIFCRTDNDDCQKIGPRKSTGAYIRGKSVMQYSTSHF